MTTKTRLSKDQLARIEAMAAIAGYVRDIKFMSGTQANPEDLIRLSEYVLKGIVEEEPKPCKEAPYEEDLNIAQDGRF